MESKNKNLETACTILVLVIFLLASSLAITGLILNIITPGCSMASLAFSIWAITTIASGTVGMLVFGLEKLWDLMNKEPIEIPETFTLKAALPLTEDFPLLIHYVSELGDIKEVSVTHKELTEDEEYSDLLDREVETIDSEDMIKHIWLK